MQKEYALTMDKDFYEVLHETVGSGASRFTENLAAPQVVKQNLYRAYRDMAADHTREREAMEWAEATYRDVQTSPSTRLYRHDLP